MTQPKDSPTLAVAVYDPRELRGQDLFSVMQDAKDQSFATITEAMLSGARPRFEPLRW